MIAPPATPEINPTFHLANSLWGGGETGCCDGGNIGGGFSGEGDCARVMSNTNKIMHRNGVIFVDPTERVSRAGCLFVQYQ